MTSLELISPTANRGPCSALPNKLGRILPSKIARLIPWTGSIHSTQGLVDIIDVEVTLNMCRIETIVYIHAIIVEAIIIGAVARPERPAATCPVLQCLHRLISAGSVELLKVPAINEAFGDGAVGMALHHLLCCSFFVQMKGVLHSGVHAGHDCRAIGVVEATVATIGEVLHSDPLTKAINAGDCEQTENWEAHFVLVTGIKIKIAWVEKVVLFCSEMNIQR